MSTVDQAFVKAISTIKALTRSPNALGKPPVENRTTLYGLYKQATEGNVQGIMPRPAGDSPQDRANMRKWDAWKEQEGLTRTEAKLKYIEYLLETMKSVSVQSEQSEALLGQLESIYLSARDGVPLPAQPQHNRTYSTNSSEYGQFLRRPTYSEFGLSQGDRMSTVDSYSVAGDVPAPAAPAAGQPGGMYYNDAQNWQSNVAWQLETISEEINSIRHRYEPKKETPKKENSDVVEYILHLLSVASIKVRSVVVRALVDTGVLLMILVAIRFVRGSPKVMARIPATRRFFTILGNLIAVMLREVGFDIRQITVSPS